MNDKELLLKMIHICSNVILLCIPCVTVESISNSPIWDYVLLSFTWPTDIRWEDRVGLSNTFQNKHVVKSTLRHIKARYSGYQYIECKRSGTWTSDCTIRVMLFAFKIY